MTCPRTRIVGIGSPHGDDQAGWLLAEQLAGEIEQDHATVRKASSTAALLDWLEGVEQLIVCDACRGLGRIGEVRRWRWPDRELANASWSGTHDLSLPAVLQLADRLGRLPKCVVIWAVEGAISTATAPISSEVAAVLPRMVVEISDEVVRGVAEQESQCTSNHS